MWNFIHLIGVMVGVKPLLYRSFTKSLACVLFKAPKKWLRLRPK